ncbi:hypothetical protein Tco_0926225 [Tanacetum coccineum]|uniref:Uncharacterized protein n=1 Tax=Tanacetum coccineum TaxID=301880 RepID=A0ABQ5DC46_9ASTR
MYPLRRLFLVNLAAMRQSSDILDNVFDDRFSLLLELCDLSLQEFDFLGLICQSQCVESALLWWGSRDAGVSVGLISNCARSLE